MPRQRRSVLIILLTAFFLAAMNPSSFAQNDALPEAPAFVEEFLHLINKTAIELKNHLPNFDQFLKQVEAFKKSIDSQFAKFLNGGIKLVENYANNQSGLSNSSNQLFAQAQQYSDSWWSKIMEFPRLKEVVKIISPVFEKFAVQFHKTLPPTRPHTPEANPMGTVSNFYTDMANKNPYGLGPLFENKPLPAGDRLKITKESTQEQASNGVQKTNVVFREILKFNNRMLVFQQLIINNNIVKFFQKREDLTVLHGIPEQMRRDGVNKNTIRWIEELLNLTNLNLTQAHQNQGLIIDPNHPQLKYPPGYSQDQFIKNVTQLFQNWQRNVYFSIKAWEQRLKSS